MPIISSLGALTYPKVSAVSVPGGDGYLATIAGGPNSTYNRSTGSNPNPPSGWDNTSSIGFDSNGHMFVGATEMVGTSPGTPQDGYYNQLNEPDASPQFDFKLTQVLQGAVTTTNGDSYWPITSGSTQSVNKTSSGIGVSGFTFGSLTGNNTLLYCHGKANLNNRYTLTYLRGSGTGNDQLQVYGGNGANDGGLLSTNFGAFRPIYGRACSNELGTTVYSCYNSDIGSQKYYIGTSGINYQAGNFVVGRTYQITEVGTTNFTLIGASNNNVGTLFTATGAGTGTGIAFDVSSNWLFETNAIIVDLVADDDYVYVSTGQSQGFSTTLNAVTKIDIVTGAEVASETYTNYGAGRFIELADDGYLYVAGGRQAIPQNAGVGKLDKNLNIQWSYAVSSYFINNTTLDRADAFRNAFKVNDGYIYGIGTTPDEVYCAKFQADGNIVNPGSWWLGSGIARIENIPGAPSSVSNTNYLNLTAVPASVLMQPTFAFPFTPTTLSAITVANQGYVTANIDI